MQEYEDQSRINLFSDDEDSHIHVQNEKKLAENHIRNYSLRSKGVVHQPQQKQDFEKHAAKQKEKFNGVPPSPNLAPIIKTAAKNKDFTPLNFSFKSELNKIKILVLLLELLKNPAYRESF